ncbi:MAG: hypothetical protein GXP56_04920 [Deltaproteobacteria bacterium]|nr:hypothetical protein [Deltaproteobacteria bacterium]
MKHQHLFKDYQQGLENGELIGVYCKKCKTFSFHSSLSCSKCGSMDLVGKVSEKSGTLETFTVIRVAAEGLTPPFIVALVRTDSGFHVMGNLEGIDPSSASMDLLGKQVKISSKKVTRDRYSQGVTHCLSFTLDQ